VALARIHCVLGLYAWQLHPGKPHGVRPYAGGLFALRWNPLAWPHSQSFFFGECPRGKVIAPSCAAVLSRSVGRCRLDYAAVYEVAPPFYPEGQPRLLTAVRRRDGTIRLRQGQEPRRYLEREFGAAP
jgi:hypothetical protein